MDQPEYSGLLKYVQNIPDKRKARGKRHGWAFLLGIVLAALVSGQKTPWAIAEWAELHAEELCQRLRSRRMASKSTFYRALRYLDIKALERQITAYARTQAKASAGAGGGAQAGQVLTKGGEMLYGQAIDGKEVRGVAAHGSRMHLLSVVRHGSGMILKQLRVAQKRNEVSALPQLWKGFDLHHTVSTFDALFTHRATAKEIVQRGGHYFMVVKGNQATLHEALQTLFAAPPWPQGEEERESFRAVSAGHGRLEQRTLVSSTQLNAYLAWPGLGQVLQRTCQRTIKKTGQQTQSVRYAITSLTRAEVTVAQLEGLWRQHWTIENPVHYVRDETLGEDRGQAAKGNTAQALAALRNGLLNTLRAQRWTSIAQALRYCGSSIQRALEVIGAVSTSPAPRRQPDLQLSPTFAGL
jgi:predicted transposase YbfD/YdcC